MTYAFITEWMQPEAVEKFDRDLRADPRPSVASRPTAHDLEGARQLMAVFGMAAAG